MSSKRTLFEKIWNAHLVAQPSDRSPIFYIDLHLVHEVTSPQAFDGLRVSGRKGRQPSRTVATVDHNIPTEPRGTPITDVIAAKQIAALQDNCKEFGVRLFDMDSPDQGIVHVIGPELGLGIIGQIGTDGASGHVIEYAGEAVRALSVEGRMTLCNMSIEAGARAGMVAPDETTFAYVKGKRFAPGGGEWEKAVEFWRSLPTDREAVFDKVVEMDAAQLSPFVTWGTNPGMVAPVTGRVPDVGGLKEPDRRSTELALQYMGLEPGKRIEDIGIDPVFIGSVPQLT